jgi:peptidoglycan/LPS O-acetylase OafA/YrhL
MTLDEVMAVWKSQDAAPLHDVNKTLLHLALRRDEAKLRKARRRERWIVYVSSAGFVAGMALCLALMIYTRDRRAMTGWDFFIGMVGATAGLIMGGAMYVRQRAQALREQRFGESLRDQLNRSIAQLDYEATTLQRTLILVVVLLGAICPIALYLLIGRINGKSIAENGYMPLSTIVACGFGVAIGVWSLRQQTRDVVLPRKRRLETLLEELDGQE